MKKLLDLLFAVLGLCACAPTATPTPDARATETEIARKIFAAQTASVPTPTRTNTPTLTPVDTPTQTSTPLVTDAVLAKDFKSDTGTPVDVTTEYVPEQKKFHLVLTVKDVPQQTKFKSVWGAVDIGGITPPNTTLEENELIVAGSGTFEFTIAPKTGQWSSGKYKVDLYVNNQLDRTLNFTVRALAPTRVLSPTRTLTPTRTPIPSATPKPSATLKPSATPIPPRGLSDAEMKYASDIQGILFNLSEASFSFSDLLDAAGKDSSLVFDNQWRKDVVLELVAKKMYYDGIRSLHPPQLFASFHADLINAASYSDSGTALFVAGMDEFDPSKINRATEQFKLEGAAVQRANEKLKKMIGQ